MLPSRVRIEDNRIPRWTVNYDGKGLVNIEPWKVEGDFSIEIKCILNSVEALASLGFKGTTTLGFYQSPLKGLIGANFMTLEGGASKIAAKSPGEFVRNLKFSRKSGVCFFYLNGYFRGQAPIDGTFGVDTLGAGYPDKINPSLFFVGKIFDVKLLDLENPLNCRHYNSILNSSCAPKDAYLADSLCQFRKNEWIFETSGVNNYIEIQPWKYNPGDVVKVVFIHNGLGQTFGTDGIIDSSNTDVTNRPYVYINDKYRIIWNTDIFSDVMLDGVIIDNDSEWAKDTMNRLWNEYCSS